MLDDNPILDRMMVMFAAIYLASLYVNDLWVETAGFILLWWLHDRGDRWGDAALVWIYVLTAVAVPEFFWSLWTGNYPTAMLDVAYFWLAWSAVPVARYAYADNQQRKESHD